MLKRVLLVASVAAATSLTATSALAASAAVGGLSSLLGLLAALWALIVARGSPIEASGATVWFVGGAVVGTAGWAGRRAVLERTQGWWRRGVDRLLALQRGFDALAAPALDAVSARASVGSSPAAPASMPLPAGNSPSTEPLIRRCPDASWPASFDREQVLAEARQCFIELQAAWDAGDHARLHQLTTPHMLADVEALLDARGHAPNRTDVLTLRAELLCIEAIGAAWCASVEFSGFIRESDDAAAAPFHELWMLASPIDDAAVRWRLARQQALL